MTQGAAEDLWHLSIDDLFVAPIETPPLEGPGPFVINLSASTAPISIPATGLPGFETLKAYQLSRKEDGRDRFRLRLGFFDTPSAATEALAALRERYPSAFAANATEEDQRFNPARPRPPKAEPVTPPAVPAAQSPSHARPAVRNDNARRGKKKDLRRDHGSHLRGAEGHDSQRNKPTARHGHGPAKSPPPALVMGPVKEEKIDVESILLAALAPATPGGSRMAPKPQPHVAARQVSNSGHAAKHPRAHAKPMESAHGATRPSEKSIVQEPAPAAPAAPSRPLEIFAKPETPAPAPAPSALIETSPPWQSPIAAAPSDVGAQSTTSEQSSAQATSNAVAAIDHEAHIVTHPRLDEMPAKSSATLVSADSEAHIVTHPRLDEMPAKSSATPVSADSEAHIVTHPCLDEGVNKGGDAPESDIPIDLHFIDRIFDDDTPTIEVLAAESPEASPAPMEVTSREAVEPTAKAEAAQAEVPEARPTAKQPPVELHAPAISAHDIIALLTQPIPVQRASKRSAKTAPPVAREAAPPSFTAVSVTPHEPPVASDTSVDRKTAPAAVAAKTEPDPQPLAASADIEVEIPTLTQVVEAESPPATVASVRVEEVSPPMSAAKSEADPSVGAMAARIESELAAILPVDASTIDPTPNESAATNLKDDARPASAPFELKLELVPDEAPSVPMLTDVFDDVIVEEVIPARREPAPAKLPQKRVGPASAPRAAPVATKPATTKPATKQPTVLPADSIFKVKNRPAQAKPVQPAPVTPPTKRPVVVFDTPVEDMDSTQTLRALTPLELNDDTQSKWFAVQLALSEEPVKVESLPHIDIFDEYRLYSISGIDQGKFLHSLRLGFFSAEGSAQAVAGYLRMTFEGAMVKRVSIAEHDRFAERKANKSEPQTLSAETRRVENHTASAPSDKSGIRDNGSNPKSARQSRNSVDSSPTGRHKTLGEQLYDEARQVALSQSAIRRLPKNSSLWSRLFGQGKD